MEILFNENGISLIDERNKEDKIFNGEKVAVCYTLESDDITKSEKRGSTPYVGRKDELFYDGKEFKTLNTKSKLTCKSIKNGGMFFELTCGVDNVSEYGIYLPFNFMGKLNGGGYQNQFLFNSPYTSKDKEILYTYLKKPNGANLVVAVIGGAEGWKMDYSPYVGGHFFVGLKLLANFDKAYNTERRPNRLQFIIMPVNDFDDCLTKIASIYDRPFLDYDLSGGKVGDKIRLKSYGKIDKLLIKNKQNEKIVDFSNEITVDSVGETEIIPVYNNKKGGEITIYGYDDLISLYKKAMDSVNLAVIESKTDGNLCEHQCWASAMLRFLIKYKDRLTDEEVDSYELKLRSLLNIVTETDETKAVPRRTIFAKQYQKYPAYNIFKSTRIQEEFFGVTILLDAFKYFNEEKYYEYAINTLNSLIDNYQSLDGRLERVGDSGEKEDYTTVCSAMIPIVDMVNFVKDKDQKLYEKYYDSASRMANYLYNRGLIFPTEGGCTTLTETEMEDGSISCTALSLLYYVKNLRNEEKYIVKAKEVLDLHESWVIETPICQMKNSSLRWWETRWEGDADGPALCCGHAWTIWRAEADYLYYYLTKDKKYLIKSLNGVMTNLSKIQEDGKTYAIYNPDFINGGGFASRAEDVVFRVANRFPDTEDCGLSRYVFIRLNEMFLKI